MGGSAIVLFDGVCNLCNKSVQFIIRRDPKGYFKFAPMQSEVGKRLLEAHGLHFEAMDTFVLIEGSRCLTRSDAAIGIAKHLSDFWPILSVLGIIPRTMRDFAYAVVARNRYGWFGKKEICVVPSKETLERFLY